MLLKRAGCRRHQLYGLARTVVELCGLGDRDLAIRAVDDFDRRGMSLNWLRLTADRLHRPGQSGTGVVRPLLDRRQAGGRVPESWFERLVELCVTLPGLPPWERQFVVRDSDHFAGRLDLARTPAVVAAMIQKIARRRAELLHVEPS